MDSRIFVFCLCCSSLLFACKKDSQPRTREQFCADWASAACSSEVVSLCQAESAEKCHVSQADFCRTLVPENFSDDTGDECIAAVKAAYKDGDLKAGELLTVLRLGKPCDGLIVGPKGEGDSCSVRSDCDASAKLQCVFKSNAAMGSCEVPVEVGGGRSCKSSEKTCGVGFYCNGENCIESMSTGDACTIQEECGTSGFCGDDGKCADKVAVSADCSADRECRTGICYEFGGGKVCTDRIQLARSEPLCDDLR